MDGNGDDLIGWLADGAAAGILGAALGASLLLLGFPLAGVGTAAAGGLAALALLRQVKPEARRFRLPAFELPQPLVDAPDILELTDIAEEVAPAEPEPLELEDRIEPAPAESRVVQLFAARPLPTPGELRQRIEAHLEVRAERPAAPVLELEVDAAAALRQALGDLRRSLA
ncbi:hypothetical protein [Sphingomonas astaxanthinifaciens]|nr:hypothetical protein [Sphingomonas astaxanthinifaciens]